MAHKTTGEPETLQLPATITGPTDVLRLLRELEWLGEALLQSALRKGGAELKTPKTSRLMDQVVWVNKLNLLKKPDRDHLQNFLTDVQKRSPVMHVSFSADPPTDFIEKLMTWLRREIHPSVLLTIGLQPNIGAGCIVRTTNKYFDLSLRQNFADKQELLLEKLTTWEKQP